MTARSSAGIQDFLVTRIQSVTGQTIPQSQVVSDANGNYAANIGHAWYSIGDDNLTLVASQTQAGAVSGDASGLNFPVVNLATNAAVTGGW